jgi:hypothetical protein
MNIRAMAMLTLVVLVAPRAEAAGAGSVDFVRDVRPILARNCLQCHGQDETTRQAGLRFDNAASATLEFESGQRAIVPGKPDESELLARVSASDESLVMPPADLGKRLTAAEIETLRSWIASGAPFTKHWAYVKPERPPLPAVRDTQWSNNPIDGFVLARLERDELAPSPPADRATLLRRLSLDLTGLPPSPEETEAFVNDTRPAAYAEQVDRLLASPAFGERWAAVWLDLARYADSQGYAPDGPRTIWRWRDWVIGALNDNMPYDDFTIAQLAGDLLPDATPQQILATGFHRNTQVNTEGGVNPEEFRHAAVVDRVNTTFAVWMGTTFACAQCHSHKYDPFTQREYYQIFSIFNQTDDFKTDDPVMELAHVGREADYARLKAEVAAAQALWDEVTGQRDAKQAEWEETIQPATLPPEIVALFAMPAEKRDQKQQDQLRDFHRALSSEWKALDQRLQALRAELAPISTTVPILRDGTPRDTFVYIRGEFQSPGEPVVPGVPAALHPAPSGVKLDRLGLARWIVDAENPLTSRVAVNRLWQELFGIGLVETAEEFGTQGDPPSHPDLLDWLAVEYRESGWNTKQMLKLLVTSATYRQSSRANHDAIQRDPHNRLLSRGPRVRLSAEMIRDQALAASGLLSAKMYGPPVQPPQPSLGLAAAFGASTDWQTSAGDERHRRAIYTRWRRNLPYPSMVAFDAPERNVCSLRRIPTNTPLQALVTLNDPVFVECAQALARRVMAEADVPAARARRAFALAVGRPATPQEAAQLVALYERSLAQLANDPAKANALATDPIGPLPAEIAPAEAASWTVVSNVVLNLDETLTKP